MGALKGQLRFTSTRSIRGLKHLWVLTGTPRNFPERYPHFIKVSKAAKLCWIWTHFPPFKRRGNICTYINVLPGRNERHLSATLGGISEEYWLLSLFHIFKKINKSSSEAVAGYKSKAFLFRWVVQNVVNLNNVLDFCCDVLLFPDRTLWTVVGKKKRSGWWWAPPLSKTDFANTSSGFYKCSTRLFLIFFFFFPGMSLKSHDETRLEGHLSVQIWRLFDQCTRQIAVKLMTCYTVAFPSSLRLYWQVMYMFCCLINGGKQQGEVN